MSTEQPATRQQLHDRIRNALAQRYIHAGLDFRGSIVLDEGPFIVVAAPRSFMKAFQAAMAHAGILLKVDLQDARLNLCDLITSRVLECHADHVGANREQTAVAIQDGLAGTLPGSILATWGIQLSVEHYRLFVGGHEVMVLLVSLKGEPPSFLEEFVESTLASIHAFKASRARRRLHARAARIQGGLACDAWDSDSGAQAA